VPDRDTYFPGTERLDPNEMRITALGTGMPSARPKQAAACFLVELGNGDLGCLAVAAIIGAVAGSWIAFAIVAVVLIACGIDDGTIRPSRRRR